jgi:hypothetical protein
MKAEARKSNQAKFSTRRGRNMTVAGRKWKVYPNVPKAPAFMPGYRAVPREQ